MIVMLSSGEYSDYSCDALFQGDRENLQKGFQAYCVGVSSGVIDTTPDDLQTVLRKFNCKRLEYEELSWDRPDVLHEFMGIEKQKFLVRVEFQRELNIEAYSSAEAELLAGKQWVSINKDASGSGIIGDPIMKPKVVSVQKLGT